MLKKVFRFLFSVCLIVLGIGMSLYPAVRSEKIHMEAISYQKEVDNAYKQNKEQKKKKESDSFYQSIKKYNEDIYKNGQKDFKDAFSYTWFPIPLNGFKEYLFADWWEQHKFRNRRTQGIPGRTLFSGNRKTTDR